MDFAFDTTTTELLDKLQAFMVEHVYPAEPILEQQLAENPDSWAPPPIVERLKTEARARGLWNLFLPGGEGAGLTNLQYAPLCETLGRSPKLGPVATNCAAPPGTVSTTMVSQPDASRRRRLAYRWCAYPRGSDGA